MMSQDKAEERPRPGPKPGPGPELSRRRLLRGSAGAAAAGGAAAVGLSGQQIGPMSMTEEADALGGLGVATVAAVSVGAGVVAGNYLSSASGDDLSDTNNTENRIHNIASAINSQTDYTNILDGIVGPPVKKTTFYRSAFKDAETAAALAIDQGKSKSESWTAWKDAVYKKNEIAAFNAAQTWGQVWVGKGESAGLVQPLVIDLSDGSPEQIQGGQYVGSLTAFKPSNLNASTGSGKWQPVEESEIYSSWPPSSGDCGDSAWNNYSCPGTGKYALWKRTVDATGAESAYYGRITEEIKKRSDNGNPTFEIFAPSTSGGDLWLPRSIDAAHYHHDSPDRGVSNGWTGNIDPEASLFVSHPTLSDVEIMPQKVLSKWFPSSGTGGINGAVLELTDASTPKTGREYFNDVLWSELSQGSLTIEEVLGTNDLANNYFGGSEDPQAAAAAAAAGVPLPKDLGRELKINHPALESAGHTDPNSQTKPDGLWGTVYIDFDDVSKDHTVTPPETVTSSEYRLAYASLTKPSGNQIVVTLSGDKNLEVLKSESGGDYTFESVGQNPLDNTANLNEQDLNNRLAENGETDDKIDDKLDNDNLLGGGAAGGLLDGIPTLPGLGAVGTIVVGVGGLLGLQALSGE